jgi:opacity protein-like surface antigen
MRIFLAAAVLLAAASINAAAQDETKNELAATIGHAFISDQGVPNTNFFDNTVHSGKGWTFSGNYQRRLRNFVWGSLGVEVPVIYNRDEDLNYGLNQVPKQYSSIFVTPAARVMFFEDLAFAPWFSFGGGLGHFVASKDLVFGGPNPGHRIKTTGALEAGVGFDVRLPKVPRSMRFRFEARDDWSAEPPINVSTGKTRQHNFYVAGGAVFRF